MRIRSAILVRYSPIANYFACFPSGRHPPFPSTQALRRRPGRANLCYGSISVTESDRPVAQRRYAGGARRQASDRVLMRRGDSEVEGWTLNVSRGGLRVVVEESLRVGESMEVVIGSDPDAAPRPARVVWVKEAADGQICGIQLLDTTGSVPPPDDFPPDAPP